MSDSEFEDKPAVRRALPLMVGLISPSGAGKTLSALRLATGMQRVTGGDIFFIDTEADRALYYADDFKFRHLSFRAPYGPARYAAAAKHCVSRGAKIVIVDSMSFEHEGPGGVLEMFDDEFKRNGEKESLRFMSWGKPKSERRTMINEMTHTNAHFIFCFRAKSKIKLRKRGQTGEAVRELGYVAITDDDLLFELPTRFLLLPGADGYPTWKSEMDGEQLMPRLPRQFIPLFKEAVQLNEDVGEQMAKWAAGDAAPAQAAERATVSVAGPVFHWKSSEQWDGLPLREAPVGALQEYAALIWKAIESASGKNKSMYTTWHMEALAEIETLEAEAALADGGAT